MSLEQTIKDVVIAESADLDMRLQQLVRAGLMPANTIPILRKAIAKVQAGMTLQGAERDVMANFINSMMFIVLGDDTIFNKAKIGAKSTYRQAQEKMHRVDEAKDESEYGYEGDMAVNQLNTVMRHAKYLIDMMKPDTDLPEWVQSKITLATDYLQTACDYMTSEMKEEVERIDERDEGKPGKNFAKIAAKAAKKYGSKEAGNRVAGAIRKKILAKESRRSEALADIAAVVEMNESYKTTFDAALTQYGIKSPSELDEEKRKEFLIS